MRKEDEWTVDELPAMPAELRAVTVVCGHYVYYYEKVRKAIGRLYSNLKKNTFLENPEVYVMKAVKKAIMRYVDAFNLRGSASKIIKPGFGNLPHNRLITLENSFASKRTLKHWKGKHPPPMLRKEAL